jgi:hypothetical protein
MARQAQSLHSAVHTGMNAMTRTPPPDEKIVQDALLRVLREHGLEPREGWVSVRLVNALWSRERTYTVIIASHPARLALLGVLRRTTRSAETRAVGVWVLNESEAHQLCAGAAINMV